MHHLLIIEDEPNLRNSLKDFLETEQFKITCSDNLKAGRSDMLSRPDVVVLDWLLPDGQGIDLLKEWRSAGNQTPVLLLTSKSDLIDKVLGLELGANDYITKPFEPKELLARIRVQLRGSASLPNAVLLLNGISMNLRTKEVHFAGTRVDLTKMEFNLLQLFMENPGQVFSRDELLNRVWGYEHYPTTRTVDTHVLQLRGKFGAECFETIRGMGYRLQDLTKNSQTPVLLLTQKDAPHAKVAAEQKEVL